MQQLKTIDRIHTSHIEERPEPMDVLWGAWVKKCKYSPETDTYDFVGIYDRIVKDGKRDFPFKVDLQLIVAYRVLDPIERGQIYPLTFDFKDKTAIIEIFKMNDQVAVPKWDMPIHFYQNYIFKDIEIQDTNLYYLTISLDGRYKLAVPLLVDAPKMMIYDPEEDSTKEMWAEDFNPDEE